MNWYLVKGILILILKQLHIADIYEDFERNWGKALDLKYT